MDYGVKTIAWLTGA